MANSKRTRIMYRASGKLMQHFIYNTLIAVLFVVSLPAEITGYFRTDGWLETDHFGSGYHVVPDRTRPNIWLRAFKYDGAVSEVVGLPNNNITGRHSNWDDPSLNLDLPDNKHLLGGDYFRLVRRIDWSQDLGAVNLSTGKCGSGRCYGDWLNDDPVWDENVKSYKDKDNSSFLQFTNEMNGRIRTRYRFQIYVEDNVAFWYKDANGGYDLDTHKSNPDGTKKYYPFQDVVFRITERSIFDSRPEPAIDDPAGDEFYIRKSEWASDATQKDDFKIEDAPPEIRWVNGRLVFNFTVFHKFRQPKDYVIQVTAVDKSNNSRTLRVPISMEAVGGLDLQNKASEGSKR